MTQKEIGRSAGGIFGAALPPNWAKRSQEDQEDYGVDYEIELTTPTDQPTGFIFKIQQKGQLSVQTNVAGTTVSFSEMPTEKLRYYLRELQIPIVLVVVDVTTKTTYWVQLQGNPQVETAYQSSNSRGQKTATIHLPTANVLPGTATRLLDVVRQTFDWLLVAQLRNTSPPRFTSAALRTGDLGKVVDTVQGHLDELRCAKIEEFIVKGDLNEAYKYASQIVDGESETVSMRIAAGINMIRIFGGLLARTSADSRGELTQLRLQIGGRLIRAVRPNKTPKQLRLYVRFMLRSARLKYFAESSFGLWLSLKAQEQTGDALTRYLTRTQMQPITSKLLRELQATYHVIGAAVERNCFHLVAQMWALTVQDVMSYIVQLRDQASPGAAQSLIQWLDQGGELAVAIAGSLHMWRDLAFCAITQFQLADPNDKSDQDRRFSIAEKTISQVQHDDLRKELLRELGESRGMFDKPDREPSIEEEIRMYRQMAEGLGVNLNDPNDDIARVINIGLADLNPERALKHCQHFFVSHGFSGIPAQMLGLPTAGSKFLHCTKHGISIMGLSLDRVSESFRQTHCSKCPDRNPHPPGWKWTREWQRLEYERHDEFAKRRNQF